MKRTLTVGSGTQQRRLSRVLPRHLLQHRNKEAHLHLRRALKERVQRGGTFRFREDAEPLFDRAELLFEVGVERGGGHFFEG